jgi:TonB family protein
MDWLSAKKKCGMALRLAVMVGIAGVGTMAFAQEGRKALIHPQPMYPDLAKELSLRGTVRVEVVIGTDGEIKSTKVLGGHPILVQAAIDALRKWKYAPGAESTVTLEFAFKPQ